MAKNVLHIVPLDDGWAVKREGNERASSTHPTQKEAIDAARTLAKEGDELVIHRPDGTIREQVTYSGSASTANDTSEKRELRPSDVMSVGTRVSWSAILEGVVIAMAIYVTLNLLAFAVGISTLDQLRGTSVAAGAAIVSMVCLLVALFMGGFVASTSTVGEERGEAMQYGVLVWGTILLLLIVLGFGLGIGFFAGVQNIGQVKDAVNNVEALIQQPGLAETISPQGLAWWTFVGVVLSLLSSVGGALVGAGPEFVLRRSRGRRVAALAPRS